MKTVLREVTRRTTPTQRKVTKPQSITKTKPLTTESRYWRKSSERPQLVTKTKKASRRRARVKTVLLASDQCLQKITNTMRRRSRKPKSLRRKETISLRVSFEWFFENIP